jgi:glycosyltransferase involved in cell wall biosynthesis
VEQCGLSGARVVANSRPKGARGARNTGAAFATGELLAFLDDDDEWLPSYLAEAFYSIALNDFDMICAGLYCQFDDGVDRPGKTGPDKLLPELFLTRNPGLVGSNFIIRRSLFRLLGT